MYLNIKYSNLLVSQAIPIYPCGHWHLPCTHVPPLRHDGLHTGSVKRKLITMTKWNKTWRVVYVLCIYNSISDHFLGSMCYVFITAYLTIFFEVQTTNCGSHLLYRKGPDFYSVMFGLFLIWLPMKSNIENNMKMAKFFVSSLSCTFNQKLRANYWKTGLEISALQCSLSVPGLAH